MGLKFNDMKKLVRIFWVMMLMVGTTMVANAQSLQGGWDYKNKKIEGTWSINDKVLKLNADFVTQPGPDLKLLFSKLTVDDISMGSGIDIGAVIGELQSTRGAQQYDIPANMNVGDYKSLIIYSQSYGIVWGAATLKQ